MKESLRNRTRWALAGLLATSVFTFSGYAQEEEELETYTVTGSRIQRIDLETPNPVVRFTREDLLSTGFTNLGDTLRSLPFNTGFAITPEGSSIGFAAGTSTVNLRGLGNNNTLVLINGRRAVPSGAGAFNGFQSVIDINSIPAAAIESMDILKDGASAVYGSDAVAGVVNVTLRRDYVGAALDASVGNTFTKDAFERSVFALYGTATANTNIVVSADYFQKNGVRNADYSFSNTADNRAVDSEDFFTFNDDGFINGVDWRSGSTFPARFFIPGTNTIRSFAAPTDNPDAANALPISRVSGVGFYDYQQDAWLYPELRTIGFNFFARHNITDNLYLFSEASVRQVKMFIGAAPAPFTSTDAGRGPSNRLIVPKENPFNPYGERYFPGAGQDLQLSTYRLVNGGPRFNDATSFYPRIVSGIGGTIFDSWNWEVAGMWAEGSYENSNPGTSFDRQVQEALDGVNIGGNILYANPFGPEDPRITDYYSGYNPTKTTFETRSLDFNVTGTIAELPAGPLGISFGGETRHDKLIDIRTTDNETGNVVGGAEGFGFEADRKVHSLYAELSIPVVTNVELQAALRFEDYSDFGTTLKPKIAGKYRITDWLLARASFSQSYKAPDLAFLYTRGNVGFTPSAVLDPKRPDVTASQIKTVGRGNPDLDPEETDTYSGGLVFSPTNGFLSRFTAEVSFFRFRQTDLITRDSPTFTLSNEDDLPAGRVIRDDLTPEEIADGITDGRLNSINTDWYNANKFVYQGFDYAVYYRHETEDFGSFRLGLEATQLIRADRTTENSLGGLSTTRGIGTSVTGYARWSGRFTVAWKRGFWAASVYTTYKHGFENDGFVRLGSTVIINPQISYSGFWDTTITVGFRNALDRKPPFDVGASGDGYAAGIHNPEPRFMYVRLSKEF